MPKIAVIGICGKSTFMPVDHFHAKGETLIAESICDEIGGKGMNQAVAAQRMGAEVSFLSAVGDDSVANECKSYIEENNIKCFLVEKKGDFTPIAFILTDKYGENRVTEYGTAELCADDVEVFRNEIISSDILLLQHEVPEEVNKRAAEIAYENNVTVILNPAPAREIDDETAKMVYLVTPNEQEAEFIDSERFENCITTLGGEGCLINGKTNIPAIDVTPVDTTGAGDTFNGVLSVCLAEGMSFEEACKYAVTASGISVSRKYVSNAIPYRNEIERRMNK